MSTDRLLIEEKRFNRNIYVYDSDIVLETSIRADYGRSFHDWADGESDMLKRFSFCSFMYDPEREYNDIIVYFNPHRIEGSDEDYLFRLIVHECNHAAVHVLEDVGIEISFDNQESMAYEAEFITLETKKWLYPRWGF